MLIFLIGFMGSGKSYIGRHLAPLLGLEHLDIDRTIEENEGMSLKELFEKKGESYFRELEKKQLIDLHPEQNLLISTGGGAPCFFDNMDVMNAKGLTIYLNRSKDSIIQRLIKGKHRRPLLAGMNKEQMENFYDERIKSRNLFYEKSKLHVGDADVDEIFNIIENAAF